MSLQNLVFALFALAAGALFPVQTAVNAGLARLVGGPVAATLISFTAGWFALLAINAALFRQYPTLSALTSTPWPMLITGGILGATFLGATVFLVPRLGAAATMCFIIAGQLCAATVIDRLGLFGIAARELSLGRLAGVALVLAGALLVRLG